MRSSAGHMQSISPRKGIWGAYHEILPLDAGGTHESDLSHIGTNVKAGAQQHCERAPVLARSGAPATLPLHERQPDTEGISLLLLTIYRRSPRPTYAFAAQIGWRSPCLWQLAHVGDLVDAATDVVGSVGDMRTDPAPAITRSPW